MEYVVYRDVIDTKHRAYFALKHRIFEEPYLPHVLFCEFGSVLTLASQSRPVDQLVGIVFKARFPRQVTLVHAALFALSARVSRLMLWRWSRSMRKLAEIPANGPVFIELRVSTPIP